MAEEIIKPSFYKEIDEALDKYEEEIGLPKYKPLKAPDCLSMSLEDLRKRSPDQLSENIFEICQYSLNIQRSINRDRAWERWAKAKIDEAAAYYLPEVGNDHGYNGKELIARHRPEVCQKLNTFLRRIRMQLDRTYDVPQQLRLMADSIRDMKFAAIRRDKEHGNSTE